MPNEKEIVEDRILLDLRERHGDGQRAPSLDLDTDPGAVFGGWIGMGITDNLSNAHDLPALAAVIEKSGVAFFHGGQIFPRLEVADAGP